MENKTQVSSGGISFAGLLFIAFLVLKLTHVIDWSWWWVFAPLWIPVAVVTALVLVWGLIALLVYIFS